MLFVKCFAYRGFEIVCKYKFIRGAFMFAIGPPLKFSLPSFICYLHLRALSMDAGQQYDSSAAGQNHATPVCMLFSVHGFVWFRMVD